MADPDTHVGECAKRGHGTSVDAHQGALGEFELQKPGQPGGGRQYLPDVVDEDPVRGPAGRTYSGVEIVAIEPDRRAWFRLTRVPGAALLVHRFTPGTLIAPARLTSRFQIDGLISNHQPSLVSGVAADVTGQHVVTVHSYRHSLGMWIAGEVLIAQTLLVVRGCASVRSIVVVKRGDEAVARVLSARADVTIMTADATTTLDDA